jgi:hypothetical protein
MSKIILEGVSFPDFREEMRSVFLEALKSFKPEQEVTGINDLFTRKEIAKKARICVSTLDNRTKDGTIQGHKIGSKILYKWSEVEASLKAIETTKYQHRRK